jgi:hypothetical protein
LAILWQASFVAEAFAEVPDEIDPRLGRATQTFEDRSTRTRDHADFVIANLDYRKNPCQNFERFSLPPSQTSSSLSLGIAQLIPLLSMRIVPPGLFIPPTQICSTHAAIHQMKHLNVIVRKDLHPIHPWHRRHSCQTQRTLRNFQGTAF